MTEKKFDESKPFIFPQCVSVNPTQCENFMILLSLRFYVKSIFRGSRSARLKFTKLSIFRAPKMAKTAVLKLLHSPKLISRKIWVIVKSWNFHTVWLQKAQKTISSQSSWEVWSSKCIIIPIKTTTANTGLQRQKRNP